MPDSTKPPGLSPVWAPHVHADRRPFLTARAKIIAAWRRWFDEQGFTEVETAILQISPGNEAHIGAFATRQHLPSGEVRQLYLHTSPEFACKKLLAAGESLIFTLAKVFRNGERGPLHHPEFTMLEWYRAHAPYQTLIEDCCALTRLAARTAPTGRLQWRGASCDPFLPPERLTVADAFLRYAGIELTTTMKTGSSARGNDRDSLAAAAADAGIRVTPDDNWGDIFSKVISDRIEPNLGHGAMTVLDRYPASEAALARLCPDDPRFAERFELYACGVELANAFGELTDTAEQRRRFEAEMAHRNAIYGDSYPLDEDFLACLDVMPQASGIALGADRLIMLATGAPSIDHVLWTPVAG